MLLTNAFTLLVLPSAVIFAFTPILVSFMKNADNNKEFSEQNWMLPFTMRYKYIKISTVFLDISSFHFTRIVGSSM